ncbi:hypothetical protein [Methanoculleus chikugoensis]|uniref:hypothetical protein n=1 Tax=Methanoculleus chikugoensis TaxID=118126 RepID=UPI001FB3E5D8|nr:hypothetical protein [Methanoculleus chikugoensis]
METDEIREELIFAAQEAALAERFGIPAEALVPLLFSLCYGGATGATPRRVSPPYRP